MYDSDFPKLSKDGYQIQSPETLQYNCIAWAAGKFDRWWWPNNIMGFWPEGIPRNDRLETFVHMFKGFGYEECESGDIEEGMEKVAIYTRDSRVLHAARQLENGKWTSKLGGQHDIEHTLEGLEGHWYGQVTCTLCRRRGE